LTRSVFSVEKKISIAELSVDISLSVNLIA
jgi:hypothetical protein